MEDYMASAMQYLIAADGVDTKAPLIYLWEIRNRSGEVVGRYVGKAENGHDRPRKDYKRNVDRLLRGLPYRRGKPDGYRPVHYALAAATRENHDIVVTYIRNVEAHENINAVEQHYIRHYDCVLGTGVGLNVVGSQRLRSRLPCRTSAAPAASGPRSYTLMQIREIVEKNVPELQPTLRSKGVAFGIDGTRILRIEQCGPRAKVKIKFAISSRRGPEVDIQWNDTPEALTERIRREVALYREHFV
jgi:hypothetical protein